MKKNERFLQNDKCPYATLVQTRDILDDYYNDTHYKNVNITELKLSPLYKCSIFKHNKSNTNLISINKNMHLKIRLISFRYLLKMSPNTFFWGGYQILSLKQIRNIKYCKMCNTLICALVLKIGFKRP